jgi:hypothetical protein
LPAVLAIDGSRFQNATPRTQIPLHWMQHFKNTADPGNRKGWIEQTAMAMTTIKYRMKSMLQPAY